jgi:RHS repeat-associated protein
MVTRTGTTSTPFMYNGRDGVMTDSNGLYYMRARYYIPKSGRFSSLDILKGNIDNVQSLNRYSYVKGKPVMYVDPYGLCEDSDNNSINENDQISQSYTTKTPTFFDDPIVSNYVGIGISTGLSAAFQNTPASEFYGVASATPNIIWYEVVPLIISQEKTKAALKGDDQRLGYLEEYESILKYPQLLQTKYQGKSITEVEIELRIKYGQPVKPVEAKPWYKFW